MSLPMSAISCTNCGHLNSELDLFCADCGLELPDQEKSQLAARAGKHNSDDRPGQSLVIPILIVSVGLLTLGALIVMWFYFTPYLALSSMRIAAQNRDAKTFCTYIDFPLLRENLKSELNAKMLAEMNKDAKLKSNPFSGLALAMGPAIINNMIDAYVSPAAIERAFKGDFDSSAAGAQAPEVASQTFNPDFVNEEKGEVTRGYDSFNEFGVSYKPKSGGSSKLIFERRGLWNWKLANIKLE
jgi:hypothetical protein